MDEFIEPDFYLQKMTDMLELAEVASTPAAKLEFMRLAEEYRLLYERAADRN